MNFIVELDVGIVGLQLRDAFVNFPLDKYMIWDIFRKHNKFEHQMDKTNCQDLLTYLMSNDEKLKEWLDLEGPYKEPDSSVLNELSKHGVKGKFEFNPNTQGLIGTSYSDQLYYYHAQEQPIKIFDDEKHFLDSIMNNYGLIKK